MSNAGAASLLPVAVVIPLVGAMVALLVGRLSARAAVATMVVALLGSGGVLAEVAPKVFGGRVLVHYLGHWLPVHGTALGIGWAADPFGLTYALVAAFVGAVLALFAFDEMSGFAGREVGQLACLFLLLEAGLIGTALTADLFNMFVWFEVAAVASYGLTAFFVGRPSSLEAAFKIVVLTTIAGFSVFVGAAVLYGRFGALNLAQLHVAASHHPGGFAVTGVVAVGLLIAGFGTKAGLIPFHGWLPDAHSAAPGAISALFSGLMVAMGMVAIARVALLVVPHGTLPIAGTLTVVGAVSALGGAALSFGQDDLKRLLAYDTIAQMGIVAIGLGAANQEGLSGATYQLLNHALFKSLLFLVAGAIAHLTGGHKLSEMGGLARRYPALAALFILGVASIIGIPPLNGYASRVLIHAALSHHGHDVTLVVLELAEIVSFGALARAAWLAFFAAPSGASKRGEPLRPGALTSLVVLGGGCVAFGVVPYRWVRGMADPAASVLAHPGRYAAGVLHAHSAFPFPAPPPPGSFVSAEVLVGTAVVVVLGGLAAWWRVRSGHDPHPVRVLRSLQTGSVNDYVAYLALGLVAVVIALGR